MSASTPPLLNFVIIILQNVLDRLHCSGVSVEYLELEVTETVFLGRGADYVERALRTLGDAGMSIALDDFGTGYASLSHLRRYPVNCIKIDRSFIANIRDNAEDAAIVNAVLDLGRALGIKVVAEGIETGEQGSDLAVKGCRYGQGFFLGRPIEGLSVPKFLTELARRCPPNVPL